MKKTLKIGILLFAGILLLLSGCKKEEDNYSYLKVENKCGQAVEVSVGDSDVIPGSGIQISGGGYHYFDDRDKRTGHYIFIRSASYDGNNWYFHGPIDVNKVNLIKIENWTGTKYELTLWKITVTYRTLVEQISE